ncbi:unnamed protein product [Durusdinium trenchii]|uniref:S1 motif domain-containing protein n=2 Tax=Durusdinium trenchii TaxID=1381693 RepID=A0ABP0IZI6_9DINO
MISPPQLEGRALSDVKLGEVLDGKVVGVAKNALFMDIGCVVEGHLTKMNMNGESPESYSMDQTVKVKITDINTERSKIELSLV